MGAMREMGEFGFIDRVSRFFATSPAVLEGVGDDCAVVQVGDRLLLVSCDLALEDVHFRRGRTSPEQLGRKIAAAAISDIAAMGGRPLFMLISMAVPAQADGEEMEAVVRGMAAMTEEHGAVIVGGDMAKSPHGLAIDVTIIGEPPSSRYLTRAGAHPGDALAVTGRLGRSAAGLHAQEHRHDAPALIEAHYGPLPRIREGQWLCAHPEVHAAIDISDGLVQDAGHLARASGVGVAIDSARLSSDALLGAYCAEHQLAPHDFMLSGGEDYELAFAVDADAAARIMEAFHDTFGLPATIVGTFDEALTGVHVDGEPYGAGGFDHFGPEEPSS